MKKTLSLILALAMILSCIFVLASCGDKDDGDSGNYDGKYVYDEFKDFKFLMGGEDMTELLGDDFIDAEETFGAYIEIEGKKISFGDPDKDAETYEYTKKNGKLYLSKKDSEKLMGAAMDELGEGGDFDLYFVPNGDTLTMYMSVESEAEGIEIELSFTVVFKK